MKALRRATHARPFALRRWLALVALWLVAFPVAAQPVPKLDSLSLEWVQRGTAVEMVFAGENLGGATGLVFSGEPGLSARPEAPANPTVKVEGTRGGIAATPAAPADDKHFNARVTVTSDALLGAREVRVVSAGGISNPLVLNVSALPEIQEREPNHQPAEAQLIELPVAISGTIREPAEADYFRFKAKAGQLLVFDVWAFRTGSPLDSSLALLDAAGKELARSEDVNGFDSLLLFTVPADGEYLVQLRDFRFEGSAKHKYRLVAGALPYVNAAFPLGGPRGQAVTLALTGVNLGGATNLTLQVAATAPLGNQELRATAPAGVSNPFLFHVGDLPETLEQEPNNAAPEANAIAVPGVVNGRLAAPKDVDVFRFKSDRDQRLILEAQAARLGSALDVLLTLTDATGKVLAQNDDADGADARIDFDKFAKDQEYTVTLKDLRDRGGENFGYRLAIHPPRPGFTAKFFPDTPRVRRGGRVTLRVEVSRSMGFNDLLRIAAAALPPGIQCEAALLAPGQPESGLLVLTAAKDAPLGTLPFSFTASGTIDGQTVTRPVTPLANDRATKEAFLTVLDAPPFTLELATLDVAVEQEQTAKIEVLALRRAGFTNDLKLSVEGYSAGREPATRSFEIGEVILKNGDTHATLNLKAKPDSEVGTRLIVVKGEATVDGQDVIESSAALPATITQLPFLLTSNLKRLAVTALPPGTTSAAGEAVFTVKAERRSGFDQEIALVLEGLPEGLTAAIEKIPAGAGEATVKLTATEKAPVGKEFTLRVAGTGQFRDRAFHQKTAPITLTVSAPEAGAGEAVTKK